MISSLLVLAVLAAILGFLVWRTAHPYRVTPQQMDDALRRVLEARMPSEEWHGFIHRKIARHPYLDSLRLRLVALPLKTWRDADGLLYHPGELQKISVLLDELRRKTA
jgi:hypothetical protein